MSPNTNEASDYQSREADELPLVTIGLPLFNEERFLEETLQSLLAQDYPRIEILIADNASTDKTLNLCERLAEGDSRIQILRSKKNLGATANFEKLVVPARGKYFMWAAGHDLWSPNFVRDCVDLLERDEGTCLAFGCSRWIDADGSPMRRASGWTDTRGLAPVARFVTVFWGNMHPITGLIRIDPLRAALPLKNIAGGDLIFLAELALRGDFAHAPNATWSRREFRKEAQYKEKLHRYASPEVAVSTSRIQRMFPLMNLPLALVSVVLRSTIPRTDKILLLAVLLASFPLRYIIGRRKGKD